MDNPLQAIAQLGVWLPD